MSSGMRFCKIHFQLQWNATFQKYCITKKLEYRVKKSTKRKEMTNEIVNKALSFLSSISTVSSYPVRFSNVKNYLFLFFSFAYEECFFFFFSILFWINVVATPGLKTIKQPNSILQVLDIVYHFINFCRHFYFKWIKWFDLTYISDTPELFHKMSISKNITTKTLEWRFGYFIHSEVVSVVLWYSFLL